MKIKKFTGKTELEATEKAKLELGANCVVMNVKKIKATGLFKSFKSPIVEVTAAVEEREFKDPTMDFSKSEASIGRFDYQANEEISLKEVSNTEKSDFGMTSQMTYEKPHIVNAVKYQEKDILPSYDSSQIIDERLESLQNKLDERFIVEDTPDFFEEESSVKRSHGDSLDDNNVKIARMVYNTLLDNEVNERFANQLMDEMDRSFNKNTSLDMLLANLYQKMILKFGQPSPIDLTGKKPKVIFFIGPTGVGKTTTIAKIASKLKVEAGHKIALFTADTYRIAAEEQLRTYANILESPLTIIYSPDDLKQAINSAKDTEVILVDTAGFSHKSLKQKEDTRLLIESLPASIEKEVFLVLSATTKYKDLLEIVDSYKEIADYKLIFTKLDETSSYGNLYNVKMYTKADMSYVTNGQNVPDDIDVFDTQRVVKKLLGGK